MIRTCHFSVMLTSFKWKNMIVAVLFFVCSIMLVLPGPGQCLPGDLSAGTMSLDAILNPLFSAHPDKSGTYILEKGEESLLARAWLAGHATKSIDVQYFIWSTDNIGILAAQSLLEAAQKGITIRVIVDDILIDAPEDTMLALASHPGVNIRIYNPKHSVGVSLPKRILYLIRDFRSSNQRMHDKTFMVDGNVAITGGRNMADEYYDFDHHYNFRDRDILLLGPVVKDMENSFEKFWQSNLSVPIEDLLKSKKHRLSADRIRQIYSELHAYAADTENYKPEIKKVVEKLPDGFSRLAENLTWEDILFIHDDPGKNTTKTLDGGGQSTQALVDAMSMAKHSITIQTPYLVMPSGGFKYFADLHQRGVSIKISTNSLASTDNLQAFSGYSKQRKKILKSGISVYEFRPDPVVQKKLIERYKALEKNVPTFGIHAKTMVIDHSILFIGTFNFDPHSVNLNTEVGVLIKNAALARQAETSIEQDMLPENSWNAAIDNPDAKASWWKRFKTFFWKLFPLTPIL